MELNLNIQLKFFNKLTMSLALEFFISYLELMIEMWFQVGVNTRQGFYSNQPLSKIQIYLGTAKKLSVIKVG